jgi:hypothetical protein
MFAPFALFGSSWFHSPAHTMLAVSDDQGNSQGYLWYDPHGSVLSSTLPVTLTQQLLSAQGLDSRLGLVYHGDGRYYDPAIAHTLQPDPFGGVPQLPQTLNRYMVPMGVSVVGQAVGSGLHPAIPSFARQMPGAVLGFKGIPQLAQLLTRPTLKAVPASTGIIEVVGPSVSVRFLEAEGFETLSIQPARGLLRGPLSRIFKGWQIQILRGRVGIAGALADETFARGESISLGRGVTARLVARDVQYVADDVATQAAAERLGAVLGVGVAGLLSAGFQYIADYNNPYLTGQQKLQRAGIAFTLGSGAAFGGLLVEYILIGSVGGPVGIIAAIPIAIGFELWVAPAIFEGRGLTEHRKLAPLN